MPARTKDMTRGNPTRLILTFCLPIVAGNLFQQLYSLVDTLVIGQVEGVTALAAVSAAGWLDWLVLGLAMGLAQGFSIQVAQCFGAADYTGLRRAVGQSLLLSAGVVVLLTVLSQSLLYPALVLLRSPANTIDLTCEYLRIIFSGITLVMGFNLLSGILRSLGDSRTPLYAMTAAALCNIALDILFVAAFHWGVSGVAIATVISQGVDLSGCFLPDLPDCPAKDYLFASIPRRPAPRYTVHGYTPASGAAGGLSKWHYRHGRAGASGRREWLWLHLHGRLQCLVAAYGVD